MTTYDYSKTVFCIAGKGNIATDVLSYLMKEKGIAAERMCLICNRTETGEDSWQRSLRKYGKERGIREVTLEEVYPVTDMVFLSLEFDRIVRPERFATTLLYNIHFSALPAYKGMYTSALPILHGKKETGVTFHEIDRGIDTGNIIFQDVFPIEITDTARDVYMKYITFGTRLVKRAIDMMLDQSFCLRGTPQPAEGSTYYSKQTIDYKNIRIELTQTADHIRNQIRAFYFPEYQTPVVNGNRICDVIITDHRSELSPGTVIAENETSMQIATIDYDVVLVKKI